MSTVIAVGPYFNLESLALKAKGAPTGGISTLTTGDIMAYKHPSKDSIHHGKIHSKVIDAGEMYPPGDKCHLPDPVGPKQMRAKHITEHDLTAERPAHLAAPVMEDGMHDESGGYDPNAKT